MAEEFQALLDRINGEYLKQAEEEKAKILADAKAQADALIASVRAEADKLRAQAEQDAEAARKRSEAAARQAARDIVLGLREELAKRLDRAVGEAAGAALTPELMAETIRAMAQSAGAEEVKILTGVRDADALAKLVRGTLAASFRKTPEVFPDRGIRAGMQVAFDGSDMYADLTEDAVRELVGAHLGAELARLLDPK